MSNSKIMYPAYSFSNFVIKVPMCGVTSIENSSPALRYSFGSRPPPTPGGVPVRITVPAGRVVPWVKKATIFCTLKIISLQELISNCRSGRVNRILTRVL